MVIHDIQGTKLFKYADVDNKGYIVKEDLALIKDYVSTSHLHALENMMRESNESYISEKEFIQMINDLAEAPVNSPVEKFENVQKNHELEKSELSDPYSLAAELSSATTDCKYEDPIVDMLRSQLDSPDYPFIVENVASRQSTPTIVEKPSYAVSIKKPQYRPIEPGDMQMSSAILGAPSLADELSEAEEGNSSSYQNQLDKNSCTPDTIFKVVFVGDSAVGKTCFLHR
ncbi:unnamed protein product [Auanema sp. JU1783]|nr:unnamed protein product [Auanema sp. JU1783]